MQLELESLVQISEKCLCQYNRLSDFSTPYLHYLDDSRQVIVYGYPHAFAPLCHMQGDNCYDMEGTCGLVACEQLLNSFGKYVTEDEIVEYARDMNYCDDEGGSTSKQWVSILNHFGMKSHPYTHMELAWLSNMIIDGHGIILSTNNEIIDDISSSYHANQGRSGIDWHNLIMNLSSFDRWESSEYIADHAIFLTGVALHPYSREIQGFFYNDSGIGKGKLYIDAYMLLRAWVFTGGEAVATMDQYTTNISISIV
jgi:hypothetical protein